MHTAHAPPVQAWLAAHEVALHTHALPPHVGVVPPHAAQLAPHFAEVLHVAQVFPLQYDPLAHWLSSTHCTQVPAIGSQTGVVVPQSEDCVHAPPALPAVPPASRSL